MAAAWKIASALMLSAKTAVGKSNVNYKTLFVKRKAKSSSKPDAEVFPGGTFEPADASGRWLDIFGKAGKESEVQALISSDRSNSKPYILQRGSDEQIDRNISLRVTAIRQTFEKTGILLCKQNDKHVGMKDITKWRSEIMHKPERFIDMCSSLNLYPDIWQLHTWNNWQTPPVSQSKLFNSVLYVSMIDSIPDSSIDESEISHLHWCIPRESLQSFYNKNVLLRPPQVYELARLLNFEDASNLLQFARERETKGLPVCFPKVFHMSDGVLFALPGDDLYPSEPDYSIEKAKNIVNDTLEKSRLNSKNLHRVETRNSNDVSVVINIDSCTGQHVAPIQVQSQMFA